MVISNETLVLYSDGDQVVVSTRKDAVRFLLISGKPMGTRCLAGSYCQEHPGRTAGGI